jgi:Sulfatase
MNSKTIVQAFGAVILISVLRVWPLLSPRHSLIYHNFLPVQSMVWGLVINLGIFTLLVALLFRYLQNNETGLRRGIWALVAAVLAPALGTDAMAMRRVGLPHVYAELLFYGTLLVALALLWLWPLAYQRAVHGFLVLLLLVGCGMAWMVPELLYFGLRRQPRDAEVPVIRTGPPIVPGVAPVGRKRIVWLLFDELSYDQAFEHRFPGVAMPVFDKLKSESVSFSDLKPAGYETERVIPSFFLGHIIEDIRSNLDGEPVIQLAGQKKWQAFDARATLFADAQSLGWTTGVVGWYNPYCRILAGTLNYCFWAGNGEWSGTTPDQTALENALVPVMDTVRGFESKPNFPQEARHAADLNALMPQAETLIRDQNIGFVFIHLPLPHPPGVYDPRHQRNTRNYIDNLGLSDEVLGELMDSLHSTSLAAETTVIVCSDHSWRLPLWRGTPQWSKKEEAATHGFFDTRPVLMIHFPGQTSERDVTVPFEEMRIYDIIERMLRGEVPDFGKSLLAGSKGLPIASKP